MRLMILLAVLALAACAGPYSIEARTDYTMAICYDPALNREQRAADDASRHCAARGLIARVQGRGRCGFADANNLTSYDCVQAPG